MSYWETMPVIVHDKMKPNTYTPIITKELFLNKINEELANPHIDFVYKISEGNNLDDNFYDEVKTFFDKEYSYDKDIHMIYKKDIYMFFTSDALVLTMYKSDSKEVIGYMVGKKANISIDGKIVGMMEVSFFCIAQKFRNNYYTPYFINILGREYIMRYDIYMGTYAVSIGIDTPYYASKRMIHKPLNISKLKQCNFLPETFPSVINFEKDESVEVIYLNNIELPDNLINVITRKLKQYQAKNYTVYNDLSSNEIKRMFENKAFHNFLIFNKDKTVRDFVSLYEIEIKVDEVQTSYTSSSIYAMFFQDNSIKNIRVILEMISSYCQKHHIIDMLSFFDIFQVDDYEKELNCFYGEGVIKYYICNYKMLSVPNYKNGYVTI